VCSPWLGLELLKVWLKWKVRVCGEDGDYGLVVGDVEG